MSDERQTENFTAVDQGTRAAQTAEEPPVQDLEEVAALLREQVRQLEEDEKKVREELAAEKRRAQEERSRRERAESAVREAEGRVVQATDLGQRTAEEARLGEVTVALDARKAQMESLKQQYEVAFTEGAGGKMAALNSEMAIVGAQIQALDAGKSQLEGRLAAAKAAPQQAPAVDQREQFMQGLTQRERDWVNDHPAYFNDPAFRARVMATAGYATNSRNMDRNSEEYIDFINQDLGLVERPSSPPPKREEQPGRSADSGARMMAAPAGGSVPNAPRGETEGAVYLTAGEKEHARIFGMSEAEYAKEKRQLLKENLIGPGARNRG